MPAALFALVLALLPLVAAADGPGLGPGWARLGPISPRPPDILAIDPDWPTSRVLLAAHQPLTSQPDPFYSYILRSRDGGEQWEILPGPGIGVSDLQLAASPSGVGPLFLIDGDRMYGQRQAVYRSTDLGSTWRLVMQLDPSTSSALALSPTFATDQLSIVVSGGVAYRSLDGGVTFSAFDPANGAAVRRMVFSPAYARDHRLFAVTDDVGAGDAGWQGLLVSTDAGETWSALGIDGLAGPDGEPMLDARDLIVSPGVERDSIMFAVTRADESESGLFRSQDGGSSWQLVAGGQATQFGRISFSLVLSPTFDNDHFATLATNYAGPTPASHTCRLQISTDGGSTWIDGPRPGSYEGCADLTVDRVNGRLVASAWKTYSFLLSLDADASWSGRLNIVEDNRANDQPHRYSRPTSTGPNGTYFVPTSQGFMAMGGGVQSVAGQVKCEPPVSGGFGRLWLGDATLRSELGCPLEAERAIRIRERIGRSSRDLWTEDDQPRFFELLSGHSLILQSKTDRFVADHVLTGATQRFEGGVMLWLPESDGQRSIIVTRGNSSWQEFPD